MFGNIFDNILLYEMRHCASSCTHHMEVFFLLTGMSCMFHVARHLARGGLAHGVEERRMDKGQSIHAFKVYPDNIIPLNKN